MHGWMDQGSRQAVSAGPRRPCRTSMRLAASYHHLPVHGNGASVNVFSYPGLCTPSLFQCVRDSARLEHTPPPPRSTATPLCIFTQ
eukprot:205979-Chlamydomonas_euryale.AAC.1